MNSYCYLVVHYPNFDLDVLPFHPCTQIEDQIPLAFCSISSLVFTFSMMDHCLFLDFILCLMISCQIISYIYYSRSLQRSKSLLRNHLCFNSVFKLYSCVNYFRVIHYWRYFLHYVTFLRTDHRCHLFDLLCLLRNISSSRPFSMDC